MTPQQLEDLESQWRSLRYKKLGEVIEMKLSAQSNATDKFLADMELERRKFVRDVMIDRWIAGGSFIISIVALLISLWPILSQRFESQSPANPSTHISDLTNNPASILQFPNTNK